MNLIMERWKAYKERIDNDEGTDTRFGIDEPQEELGRLAKGLMEDDEPEEDDEDEEELLELNPAHDAKTGQFPKGGGKKGDSYSLSHPAVKDAGWDDEKAKKGIYTGNKDKEGNRKLSYKFGMPKCGRKAMSGEKQTRKKHCAKFPDDVSEDLLPKADREQVNSIDALRQKCSDSGFYDLERLLKTINNINLAAGGELGKPKK
jgi:hypothetical protein